MKVRTVTNDGEIKMDRSNCCKNCKYCAIEENFSLGECRRHSPVYVNRIYFSDQFVEAMPKDSIFPVVLVDWWCGDFEI